VVSDVWLGPPSPSGRGSLAPTPSARATGLSARSPTPTAICGSSRRSPRGSPAGSNRRTRHSHPHTWRKCRRRTEVAHVAHQEHVGQPRLCRRSRHVSAASLLGEIFLTARTSVVASREVDLRSAGAFDLHKKGNVNEHHQRQTTACRSRARSRRGAGMLSRAWRARRPRRPPRLVRHGLTHPGSGRHIEAAGPRAEGHRRLGVKCGAAAQRSAARSGNPSGAPIGRQGRAYPGLLPSSAAPRVGADCLATHDGDRRHHARRVDRSRTRRGHRLQVEQLTSSGCDGIPPAHPIP
jgi:hypothetical protein